MGVLQILSLFQTKKFHILYPYSFGIEMRDTFIHPIPDSTIVAWVTKVGKVLSRFQTETGQKPYPLISQVEGGGGRPFVLFFSRVSAARKETLILLLTVFSLLQVPTKKIHMYTIIQTLAWAFLFGIKLSPLAPSFPFFIICLIPLRKLLGKFYEEHELEEVSLG